MSEQEEDGEFVTRVGPLEVDWPQSLGYFAGIGLAVALDLIAPPLALFVAAVPFLKLLKRRDAPLVQRAIAAVLEGVAKPVGGDTDSTVRLAEEPEDGHDQELPGEEEQPTEATPERRAPALN